MFQIFPSKQNISTENFPKIDYVKNCYMNKCKIISVCLLSLWCLDTVCLIIRFVAFSKKGDFSYEDKSAFINRRLRKSQQFGNVYKCDPG